ncbi:MAG: thioredoxin fold domain-containing protein [Flavobacteriales bacterium]|nr:thioredoxin fold domain-containing protein [Flavobacteriales bacterium]
MKHSLILLVFLIPLLSIAQEKSINWVTIEEAQELVKEEPRKIMMDVYTHWCGPCKMMMRNTFTNPDVIEYINANYYAVKFNAESADPVTFKDVEYTNPNFDPNRKGRNGVHQFTRYMGVKAYPTIVYLDENMTRLTNVSGYKTPTGLELMLKFIAEEKYKEVKTQEEWNDYQAEFTPEFKE